MTNYYEELQLEKGSSAEEIRKQIVKLQRVWIQRQINSPEKATAKLLLINEALEVFKSEDSKHEYDSELASSNVNDSEKRDDPSEIERIQKLIRYRQEANQFFGEGKYDLAKAAIDNALKVYNPSTDEMYYTEYRFMTTAAWIYSAFGDENGALRFTNEAIVKCPEDDVDTLLENYGIRSDIFINAFLNAVNSSQNYYVDPKVKEYYSKAKEDAGKAYSLLKQASDDVNTASRIEYILNFAEILAYTNENDLGAASAFAQAKDLAQQAIQMGDTSGRAHEIIKMCNDASQDTLQPYQGNNHPSTKSGGGCYIATAVYGSYDCPQVWVLRRYRDYRLLTTWYGFIFVKVYYAISPTVVKIFGNTVVFNRFWKVRLDKMVKRLLRDGYSSEKYYDD